MSGQVLIDWRAPQTVKNTDTIVMPWRTLVTPLSAQQLLIAVVNLDTVQPVTFTLSTSEDGQHAEDPVTSEVPPGDADSFLVDPIRSYFQLSGCAAANTALVKWRVSWR